MFDIGGPELLLILFIALLVFGPRRLPELGRKLGEATGYLRRASRDMRNTLEREVAVDEVRKEAASLEEARRELRRDLVGVGETLEGTVEKETGGASADPVPRPGPAPGKGDGSAGEKPSE